MYSCLVSSFVLVAAQMEDGLLIVVHLVSFCFHSGKLLKVRNEQHDVKS